MENKKFKPSEAMAYGIKTSLDNVRFLFLSKLIYWGCGILGFFLILIPYLYLAMRPMLVTPNVQFSVVFRSFLPQFKHFPSFIWAQITTAPYNTHIVVACISIAWMIFMYVLSAGYVRMLLKFYDTGIQSFRELFKAWDIVFSLIGLFILLFIIIGAGFILFVFPGLYLCLRLCMSFFILIDKKCGAFKAINESYRITKGHVWQIATPVIIFGIVNALSPILLPIMIFLAVIPLTWIYIYRHLIA